MNAKGSGTNRKPANSFPASRAIDDIPTVLLCLTVDLVMATNAKLK